MPRPMHLVPRVKLTLCLNINVFDTCVHVTLKQTVPIGSIHTTPTILTTCSLFDHSLPTIVYVYLTANPYM